MSMYLISSTRPDGFFRCGTFFPREGRRVAANAFSEAQWARLHAEPSLKIAPAPDDTPGADAEARAAIAEAIADLDASAYQQDGKPKVAALRDVLADDVLITAAIRDEVFQAMQAEGFEPPEGA
ncbi:HI1506-related protein [Sediminimonas sp.]|uniref:HI1506-related protein n=1 Tax=Sediminimonas sp. TaxID=2823379 RepID=UPI0025E66752|nr:HI1506-related protein [Sediminimonas sp.]